MAQWVAPEFTRPVGAAQGAVGGPYDWTRALVICGVIGTVVVVVVVGRWLVWRRAKPRQGG